LRFHTKALGYGLWGSGHVRIDQEQLVRQALPGVSLTHEPKPSSEVPGTLNCQYFSVAITRVRNLAAYVPGDLPNPNLELILLLPAAS
jgi:type VI secretion system protein ImpJ